MQGTRVNVENVRIFNFNASSAGNGNGILLNPTTGALRLHVTNTVFRNNGTATQGSGIRLAPTGTASAQITIENSEMSGNFRGIDAAVTGTTAGNTISINRSAIVHSVDNAINGATNANALNIMIDDVTMANNLRGVILAGAGGQARIGDSRLTHNGTAVSVSGGSVIQSYKNNQIDFNTNNGTPIPAATPE